MSEGLVATVKELLTRPIAFHPALARICGSVNAGLLLGQAIYWSERLPDEREGWFFKTTAEWTAEIVLTRHEQDGARAVLAKLGLIETALHGVPPKLHYRVNLNAVTKAITQFAEKRQIELTETGKLNCRKLAKQSAEKRHNVLPKSGKSYKEASTTRDYTGNTPNLLDEANASPSNGSQVGVSKGKQPPEPSLYSSCVEVLSQYWKQHNPDLDFVFGAKAGKNLKQLIKENPSLTVAMFEAWVTNRSRSGNVNHAQDPFKWILKLKDYAKGPVDRFGVDVRSGTGKRPPIDITTINHSAGHEKRADGSLIF